MSGAPFPDTRETQETKDFYSRKDVVEGYREADYLTPAENHLFDRYWRVGQRVLDLGVGGGRTSERLAQGAVEYVGVDFIPEMVEACRQRWPALDFRVLDAAELSGLADGHFDLVVFSFNGLGWLHPDAKRQQALQECLRVLKPGGTFIFSLHYSRSFWFRLPAGAGLRAMAGWALQSLRRMLIRVFLPQFWRGHGYFYNAWACSMTYFATPAVVSAELQAAGFTLVEQVGDDFPRRNVPWMTRWYYYVARK